VNHLTDEQVVIGVDPGKVAGWGVLSVSPEPRLLKRGQINFSRPTRAEFRTASEMIRWAFVKYKVVMVAIEDQYFDENDPRKIASTIKLCRAAGRWEEAACAYGLPYVFLKPSQWQSAVLGSGKKPRAQLKLIAQRLCAQRHGVRASEHIADGCMIGTYAGVEMHNSIVHQIPPFRSRTTRKPARVGRSKVTLKAPRDARKRRSSASVSVSPR
jgi:Holliday junction resolvasome RuvABC endonuclease subunit